MFKGLGNLANLGSMLRDAQQIGGKLEGLNDQLRAKRATGNAAGGLLSVDVNGLGEVLACRVDPSLDREIVEDLLPAAINQALAKARQLHAEQMQSLAAGFDLPGLGQMMSQFMGAGPLGPGAGSGPK